MSEALARHRLPVLAIVQARMSSRRFPGKVLAPFRGEPLILHVVRRVGEAVGAHAVVVATSTDASDDPLAAYLNALEVQVFRGPLDDVLERFRLCVRAHPCEWVLRVTADGPLIDPTLVQAVLDESRVDVDVVTTVAPRTVPHGQSVELVRAEALLTLDDGELTDEDREHVTQFFYRAGDHSRIRSVAPAGAGSPDERLVVDTVEDLARLESLA